eukprot:2323276-Alexandrium_andersonii.AAC.1
MEAESGDPLADPLLAEALQVAGAGPCGGMKKAIKAKSGGATPSPKKRKPVEKGAEWWDEPIINTKWSLLQQAGSE